MGLKEWEIFPQDSIGSQNCSEILKENYVRVDCQGGRGFFSKFNTKCTLSRRLPHWPGRGRILMKVTIKGAFPSSFLLYPSMLLKALISLRMQRIWERSDGQACVYPHSPGHPFTKTSIRQSPRTPSPSQPKIGRCVIIDSPLLASLVAAFGWVSPIRSFHKVPEATCQKPLGLCTFVWAGTPQSSLLI